MSASLTVDHAFDRAPARSKAGGGTSFRPDIEGLRAVAVLAVVLSHAGVPFFGGGYIGVDVFFVISGFLITSLLWRERATTGTISIKGFYARRATRLLPASTLVLLSTLAAAWLWLPATRFPSIATDGLASAFYAVNFRLASEGTDYLNAEEAPSPLQHFWSLAVEEQFYFAWPLLLILATLAWRAKTGSPRKTPTVLVLLAILAGSLTLSVLHTATQPPWAYFGIHTRAWELAAGALIALFTAELAALGRRLAALLTWAGLAAIAAAAALYSESTAFPGYAAILPVAGTAAVIAAGCARPKAGAGLLLNRGPFQFLGKVSYGFYLWHWPILLIAPVALDMAPSVPLNLVLCAVALALSIASLHLVENPVRLRKSLKAAPWRGIGLGAGLTGGAAALAVVALVFPPPLSGGGVATDTAKAVSESTWPQRELSRLIEESLKETSVPANLVPGLDQAKGDRPVIYDNDCHAPVESVVAQSQCVYGDPNGDKTVVLMGDSHAAQWFPALDQIAQHRGWKLLPRTKSSCPAPVVLVYNSILKREYDECMEWREDTMNEISQLEPELVIMASSDADNNRPIGVDDPDEAWAAGWLQAYMRTGWSENTKLVNILDTPWAKTNIPDCLSSNIDDIGQCNQAEQDAIRQPERRQMLIEVFRTWGIDIIDPTEWFCQNGQCPTIVGNMLVYRDGHHITTDYMSMLAPFLQLQLPRL